MFNGSTVYVHAPLPKRSRQPSFCKSCSLPQRIVIPCHCHCRCVPALFGLAPAISVWKVWSLLIAPSAALLHRGGGMAHVPVSPSGGGVCHGTVLSRHVAPSSPCLKRKSSICPGWSCLARTRGGGSCSMSQVPGEIVLCADRCLGGALGVHMVLKP